MHPICKKKFYLFLVFISKSTLKHIQIKHESEIEIQSKVESNQSNQSINVSIPVNESKNLKK